MALIVAQNTGLASVTAAVVMAKPASATNGDLMILAFTWADTAALSSGPAPGWNFITAVATSSSIGNKLVTNFYWKKASAEPAQYSANFTFGDFWAYQMTVIRGQNGSSSALDSTSNILSGTAAGAGNVMSATSVAIGHAGSLRLVYGAMVGFAGGPLNFDAPAGYTALSNQITSTAICACAFSKIVAGSGTDASVLWTASAAGGDSPWVSITIAIAASAGTPAAFCGWMSLQGIGR